MSVRMEERMPLLGINTFGTLQEDKDIVIRVDTNQQESTLRRRHQQLSNTIQEEHSVDEEDLHNPEKHLFVEYGSLDYDTAENCIQDKESSIDGTSWQLTKKFFNRWLVCFVVAVLTAGVAAFIDFCIEEGSAFKFRIVKSFVEWCVSDNCMYIPLLIWLGINAGTVFIAACLVALVEPCAAGSGIPQIKCFLNGVKVPNVVRLKTLVCKALGVIMAVIGGLAVGKEGPMIHSGAVVAAGVSQGRSTSLGIDLGMFEVFRTDQEKRDFVSAGAAAGVAAAFGAPVGGMLFSLEEGASFWNQLLTWRIFFAGTTSSFALNVFLSYMKGEPWKLSNPGLINFGRFDDMSYEIWEIAAFALMGCLGGLTGAIFIIINQKLTLFRQRRMYNKYIKILEAVIVAIVTAALGYNIIFIMNDCKPLMQSSVEDQVKFFCSDGYGSSTANLFLDTPENSVRRLFHAASGSFDTLTLACYTFVYFFLALTTYGLSVPSGLFIPCLLVGAGWGRIFGQACGYFSGFDVDLGKYALIGAAAQLGGIVRMTVSLTVIILEATGNISLGLCVMITLICAKWTGDYIGGKLGCAHGIYDMHIHLSGVPILDWEPPAISAAIHAREVMSHPVTVFRMQEKVGYIVDMLNEEIHSGFPVVADFEHRSPDDQSDVSPNVQSDVSHDGQSDEHTTCTSQTFGKFKGTILRHQLIVLLKRKMWMENPFYNELASSMSMDVFRDTYPRYPPIHHISITPEEREYTLDLEPFMNTSPYTVHETASFPRVFKLFRGLGLRHLVIVNSDSEVVGMVTRKDLARYDVSSEGKMIYIEEKIMSHGQFE